MNRIFYLAWLVFSVLPVYAQQAEYITAFVPYSVTYNGSDDPGVCWESVDVGAKVDVGNRTLFFTMPALEFEQLKEELRNKQVTLLVIYYDEPAWGSFAHGMIQKIIYNGSVVFSAY